MGFVEGVVGKVINFVIDVLRRLLRDAVGKAALDAPALVAVNEGVALGLDLVGVLFGDGAAHHVRAAQRVARQLLEDHHDLLLIDDAAVGVRQDGLQHGVLVGDEGGIRFAGDEPGDGLHRAGAVQGVDGGQVTDGGGLHLHAHAGHAGGFHLKQACGAPGGDHLEHLRVVLGQVVNAHMDAALGKRLDGVVQHRQVAQGEEVHLQQAKALQRRRFVLGDDALIVARQRDVLIHRLAGDDHARRVLGGVAGHTLDGTAGVDDAAHRLVLVVHLPQGLGHLQRLVQRDLRVVRAAGHLLGDNVHLGIGAVQHPPHIPDDALGRHGAEGDDLRHMVGAVLAVDVVDDLAPAAVAEVHIDIGHGDALRVQEALEVQVVLHGVYVGDVHAVGHHAARAAAAPRADGDVVVLGVLGEVGHDEEVIHKAHLADHVHLVFQTLAVLLRLVGVAAAEAVSAQLFKPAVSVVALGIFEFRQVIGAELKVHLAALGDLHRVVDGLRVLGEEGAHLVLALDVELLCLELHAAGVVQRLARLDAHQHVLRLGVLLADVVGVVGGHQRDASLLAQAVQPGQDLPLLRKAVILDLKIVVLRPHDGAHGQGVLLCALIVPGAQAAGDLTGQTAGQGDQPLVVLPQQVEVDAGLDIKALHVGLTDHIGQVAVARLVHAQQHQMPRLAVQLVHLVEPGAGRDVHLTADDRVDALRLAGAVKIHAAVHHAVVGDGDAGLAQLLHPLGQRIDAARAVQQGILRMHMKMGKSHRKLLFAGAVPCIVSPGGR